MKGNNIHELPSFEALPDELEIEVLLKVGNNISTDEILPAGTRVLPYRSNIPRIREFVYVDIDPSYAGRAMQARQAGRGHAIVGGNNYGQGSSREHAALAPRYLGLRVVLARSFARIHWQNLINFGILPLVLENPQDYEQLATGARLKLSQLKTQLKQGSQIELENLSQNYRFTTHQDLSPRQRAH